MSEIPSINTSKPKVGIGFLLGGIAGFVGGVARLFLGYGWLDFGVGLHFVALPIASTVAGIFLVFLVNLLISRSGLVRSKYMIICTVTGFLAGFLPFRYYWAE